MPRQFLLFTGQNLCWLLRSLLQTLLVCTLRLEAEVEQVQTQAAALRTRQGAFQGTTSRGAGQVEMLTGLQTLLSIKLKLQKDMSTEAGKNTSQRLFSNTASGVSPNPYGSSETNVMTL